MQGLAGVAIPKRLVAPWRRAAPPSHSTNVVNIDLFQFLSARRTARTIVDHNVHAISEQVQVANLEAFNGQMRPFPKIGDQVPTYSRRLLSRVVDARDRHLGALVAAITRPLGRAVDLQRHLKPILTVTGDSLVGRGDLGTAEVFLDNQACPFKSCYRLELTVAR